MVCKTVCFSFRVRPCLSGVSAVAVAVGRRVVSSARNGRSGKDGVGAVTSPALRRLPLRCDDFPCVATTSPALERDFVRYKAFVTTVTGGKLSQRRGSGPPAGDTCAAPAGRTRRPHPPPARLTPPGPSPGPDARSDNGATRPPAHDRGLFQARRSSETK